MFFSTPPAPAEPPDAGPDSFSAFADENTVNKGGGLWEAKVPTAPVPESALVKAEAPSPAPAPSTAVVVVANPIEHRRPSWQNVDGFPSSTIQLEQRKLNNFADINSYASRRGYQGFRPLDCKGQNGGRPIQMWKEMLRGGPLNN